LVYEFEHELTAENLDEEEGMPRQLRKKLEYAKGDLVARRWHVLSA
jgi:hypothetical protein